MMLEGEGRFENRPYGGGWVGFEQHSGSLFSWYGHMGSVGNDTMGGFIYLAYSFPGFCAL